METAGRRGFEVAAISARKNESSMSAVGEFGRATNQHVTHSLGVSTRSRSVVPRRRLPTPQAGIYASCMPLNSARRSFGIGDISHVQGTTALLRGARTAVRCRWTAVTFSTTLMRSHEFTKSPDSPIPETTGQFSALLDLPAFKVRFGKQTSRDCRLAVRCARAVRGHKRSLNVYRPP
jgi:hypothetical protein